MRDLITPLLFIIATLVGYGDKEIVQTVPWYKSQNTERKAMIIKCKANPGELALAPNCVNAKQADNEKALARRGWLTPNTADFGKSKD